MDDRRFDSLARSFAAPRTRRGLLGGLAALVAVRATAAQTGCPIPGQTRNRKGDCHCPPGTDACPNGCANTRSDPTNCGACGNVCLPGEECRKGECRCPVGETCGCPAGTELCGGECLDTQSDPANCGGCGTVCGTNEVCNSGSCVCPTENGGIRYGVYNGACYEVVGPGGRCSKNCPSGSGFGVEEPGDFLCIAYAGKFCDANRFCGENLLCQGNANTGLCVGPC